MGRSLDKPHYMTKVTTSYLSQQAKNVYIKHFKLMNRAYGSIYKLESSVRYYYLNCKLSKVHLVPTYRPDKLTPAGKDSILRIYTLFSTWLVLDASLPGRVSSRLTGKVSSGAVRSICTSREMVGIKFGEFIRTKRSRPFRSKVDKKKFSKLQRDVEKREVAKQQQLEARARALKKAAIASSRK